MSNKCFIPGWASECKSNHSHIFCYANDGDNEYYINEPDEKGIGMFTTVSDIVNKYTKTSLDSYINKSSNCQIHKLIGLLLNITNDHAPNIWRIYHVLEYIFSLESNVPNFWKIIQQIFLGDISAFNEKSGGKFNGVFTGNYNNEQQLLIIMTYHLIKLYINWTRYKTDFPTDVASNFIDLCVRTLDNLSDESDDYEFDPAGANCVSYIWNYLGMGEIMGSFIEAIINHVDRFLVCTCNTHVFLPNQIYRGRSALSCLPLHFDKLVTDLLSDVKIEYKGLYINSINNYLHRIDEKITSIHNKLSKVNPRIEPKHIYDPTIKESARSTILREYILHPTLVKYIDQKHNLTNKDPVLIYRADKDECQHPSIIESGMLTSVPTIFEIILEKNRCVLCDDLPPLKYKLIICDRQFCAESYREPINSPYTCRPCMNIVLNTVHPRLESIVSGTEFIKYRHFKMILLCCSHYFDPTSLFNLFPADIIRFLIELNQCLICR